MNLKEKIENDFLKAYKTKQEKIISVLRMIKSAIKNKEIAIGKNLNDLEIIEIISKEIKQRQYAFSEYQKGNRPELAQKEQEEIEILKKYLPEQLSETEIIKIVEAAIDKLNATNMDDIGKVMAEIMPKLKGKADGALISKIVKEKLAK